MPPGKEHLDNEQYKFLVQNQQPAKKGLSLPGLPKWMMYALAGVGALLIIIILVDVFSGGGGGGNNQKLIDLAAQETEIARVSGLVIDQSKDDNAIGLAATTQTSMDSQVAQWKKYFKENKIKAGDKQFSADQDKSEDSKLQTAVQNNNLESTYYSYLKTNLTSYASNLSAQYNTAGPKAKALLKSAYDSTQTILSAPELK